MYWLHQWWTSYLTNGIPLKLNHCGLSTYFLFVVRLTPCHFLPVCRHMPYISMTISLITPLHSVIKSYSPCVVNSYVYSSDSKNRHSMQEPQAVSTVIFPSLSVQRSNTASCGQQDITVTSQWMRWRLRSPASRLFTQPLIQTQIKENIKAPRHWPLCWEFTGNRWIPIQMASNAANVSIRHHDKVRLVTFETHSWAERLDWRLLSMAFIYLADELFTARSREVSKPRSWDVMMIISRCKLTGISAALLPVRLSNFRAICKKGLNQNLTASKLRLILG